MKIISIAVKGSPHDLSYVVVNDSEVTHTIALLSRADTNGLFEFKGFPPDPLADILSYVQAENVTRDRDIEAEEAAKRV